MTVTIHPTAVETIGNELVFTRRFDAPRALVYRTWVEPAHMAQWFGPHGFSNTVEMDVRPGGHYRIVMHSPDGTDYPLKGVFREVVENERLVMSDNWEDHPADWHAQLQQLGGDPAEKEMLWTVIFEDHGTDQTQLTIRCRFASLATRDAMAKMGMADGWSQSLDRLETLLIAH